MGIDKEQLSGLFSMFNSESNQVLKTSGVGIGLTTAKTLTTALQGAISLESVKGEGTKVAFSVLCSENAESIKADLLYFKVMKIQQGHLFAVPSRHFEKMNIKLTSNASSNENQS